MELFNERFIYTSDIQIEQVVQMGIFTQENRIKCGNCGTEFDFNRNAAGCPLCFFGSKKTTAKEELKIVSTAKMYMQKVNYLAIPPELKLKNGNVTSNKETETWGSWLMFNDFFAPKFLARVLAWKLYEKKAETIVLKEFMVDVIQIIRDHELMTLKGFPDLEKDRNGNRLVNHFIRTSANMGLFEVKLIYGKSKDVWTEKWDAVFVSLTREGLEFARLKNTVFDDHKKEQVLTSEEKGWLIDYLKLIDRSGYKEYSVLKEIYDFLKAGHNGNNELWAWFEKNEKYRNYIKFRSEKANKDPKIFQKQLHNYARSFASAKISLLRELGIVKDKRNDYTILGEF